MSIFSGNNKNSSEDMYKHIYNTYRHRIFVYLSTRVHDRNDMRDIIQNVFVHLWQYKDSLGGSDLENIIFKTCNQETSNFFKKKKSEFHPADKRDLEIQDTSDELIESLLEMEQQLESVKQNIELLPPKTKEIFTLNKIDGLTQKQIAINMNITVKAVEKHVSKATQFLKKNIKNQ